MVDPYAVVALSPRIVTMKKREDALREATGDWMIRLIWSDLDQPSRTAARIRTKLARAS